MHQKFLPYGRQTIEDDDVAAVVAALHADYLTTGPRVEQFEKEFARAVGARDAVACNSGTAALHLAALAIDLGPGHAAIVPTMTFLATANAIRMTGAEVVFADVDPATGLMTAETFAAALSRAQVTGLNVRAAFPVHVNGQLCDMASLAEVAGRQAVQLVEDACHALGITGVGSTQHSTMACFSTHPVKAIATGEGGVVTSADRAAMERIRRLRTHGMIRNPAGFENRDLAFDCETPNPWYYEMHEIGWNYRMPDLLCALGTSQLAKLDRFHRRRTELAALYDRLLAPLAPVIRPVSHSEQPHGWHLYAILVDFTALRTTRSQFMARLRSEGIGSQVHYIPVHRQPYYSRRYGDQPLPGAEAYYARCLSIPLYPTMDDDDAKRVVDALSRAAGATSSV